MAECYKHENGYIEYMHVYGFWFAMNFSVREVCICTHNTRDHLRTMRISIQITVGVVEIFYTDWVNLLYYRSVPHGLSSPDEVPWQPWHQSDLDN